MAKKVLADLLWDEIAPLFPPDLPRPKDGRPPVGSPEALIDILFAWINQFRRFSIRYERYADPYRAFLVLAAAIICCRTQGFVRCCKPASASFRKEIVRFALNRIGEFDTGQGAELALKANFVRTN